LSEPSRCRAHRPATGESGCHVADLITGRRLRLRLGRPSCGVRPVPRFPQCGHRSICFLERTSERELNGTYRQGKLESRDERWGHGHDGCRPTGTGHQWVTSADRCPPAVKIASANASAASAGVGLACSPRILVTMAVACALPAPPLPVTAALTSLGTAGLRGCPSPSTHSAGRTPARWQ
jgi:hypothetical protein